MLAASCRESDSHGKRSWQPPPKSTGLRCRRVTSERDVIARLKAHRADIEQMGVRYLAIFGSVARGEVSETSDVDVLIDLRETPSLFERARIKHLLGEVLLRNVDLVPRQDVRPQLKEDIEREAIRVIQEKAPSLVGPRTRS